jgi:hypothetical protein
LRELEVVELVLTERPVGPACPRRMSVPIVNPIAAAWPRLPERR